MTGTARGLKRARCETSLVGVSVDLRGLHMASDHDFNRKSFTTGHTGFGLPFATSPDRVDVARNAARPLRYLDRYVLVTQGQVFYATEMLAQLEGIERGPAGNTSLAAAISIARNLPKEEVIVVQESEYTGAGKHPHAQLMFAQENGIRVYRGDPWEAIPGQSVVIPEGIEQMDTYDLDMREVRTSYLKRFRNRALSRDDLSFLAEETRLRPTEVEELIQAPAASPNT